MTPFEYIKNHVNIKLSPSKIDGVGVFALKDIEENEYLFIPWMGEDGEYLLTNEEVDSLDSEVKSHLLNMFDYKNIDGKYMVKIVLNNGCHWIFKTPQHWVNSCSWDETPNIDVETFKANRKIKKGEEILLKYGKYDKFKKTNII